MENKVTWPRQCSCKYSVQLCDEYNVYHDSAEHHSDKDSRDVVLGSIISEYSVTRDLAKKLWSSEAHLKRGSDQ